MDSDSREPQPPADSADRSRRLKRGIGWLDVTLIVITTMAITLVLGALAVRYVLFADQFEPVRLDTPQQQLLDRKLAYLDVTATDRSPDPAADRPTPDSDESDGRLQPEPYREGDRPREVHFNERELNAIIARDPELARRLAVDLSHDLISAKLLVPLPPDFPVMGGQTVRLSAGAEVREVVTPGGGKRLAVIVTGVSLWGMPLPNAWIGGLRGVDLIEQFGSEPGFWQALADGVESVQVREGELVLRLAE